MKHNFVYMQDDYIETNPFKALKKMQCKHEYLTDIIKVQNITFTNTSY